MFNPLAVVLAMLTLVGLLFLIALWIEDRSDLSRKIANSPVVYALSLAVFASTWTYYGSVGKAVSSGMLYATVYIGPTLVMLLWWQVMRRMVRIKEKYRVTSIADFISARYDRSLSLAALASCAALFGTTPYIALQIKSVAATFHAIADAPGSTTSWVEGEVGLMTALLMIGFTIIIGVRKLDPTEQHQGMITVVAVQSIIKLAAFLACGVFITYGANHGFSDIFTKAESLGPQLDRVLSLAGPDPSPYSTWTTYLILSMAAIIFLPRQFHVAVIENGNENHIKTAMWMLPLYLLLISIFVIPIALEGLLSDFPAHQADTFVLKLPLWHGQDWLALCVFIGGVCAALSMVMISSMTLSIMLTNHILLPAIGTFSRLGLLRRHLLRLRWFSVALVILVGHWFESTVGDAFMLVNMGMISFAAALQFAPCVLGGIFFEKANKTGAQLGLAGGFATWFYTLVIPTFARSGWAFESLTADGPFGIEALKPEALFGLTAMDPLAQSVFWSMAVNIGLFLLGSGLTTVSGETAGHAKRFVHVLSDRDHIVRPKRKADISLAEKSDAIIGVLSRYMNEKKAGAIYLECLQRAGLSRRKRITLDDLADLLGEVESGLAGTVGAAEAHIAIMSASIYTEEEQATLSAIYADMLADLKLTPGELKRRIDRLRERESVLSSQAEALELSLLEQTEELKEARAELEAFADLLTPGLRAPLLDIDRLIQSLSEDDPGQDHETADTLEHIRRTGRGLHSRIDDLQSLSRLVHMRVERETVDLGEMMLDAVMLIRESTPDSRVTIEIEPGLKTEADPQLTRLLVSNLVANAWKFCADAPSPKITFGKEIIDGREWFVLRDNGKGFDMRDAEKLFKPFTSLHTPGRFESSGIGLAIAERIVRKHGGAIRAEGEVDTGATFRFTL